MFCCASEPAAARMRTLLASMYQSANSSHKKSEICRTSLTAYNDGAPCARKAAILTCLPASPKLYVSRAAVTAFTSLLLRLMIYL